jgi:hypothetical protein
MLTAGPIIFLGAFIGGLVLAVFSMLHGVERARRKRNRSRAPSPYFNLPAVAAFATGFGLTGYLLTSRAVLPVWADFLLGLAGGVLMAGGIVTLLAAWALRGVTGPSAPDEHDIQGQPAVVTQEISLAGAGEISYDHQGSDVRVPARSLDTHTLPAGAEVVIDRIEDGVAYVEDWAIVERRL